MTTTQQPTPGATMPDEISAQFGRLRTYTDTNGTAQTAVDGPNGTWLITHGRYPFDKEFTVWKSDSLKTDYRDSNIGRAIERAFRLAGVED
jgi:hypothetical protein